MKESSNVTGSLKDEKKDANCIKNKAENKSNVCFLMRGEINL